MAHVQLNKKAVEQAERLIKAGEFSSFDSNWEAEKPTNDEITYYLNTHNLDEYGMWYLGINSEAPANDKIKYDYPYGDLKTPQRCALEYSIARAEKAGHKEVAQAAKRLLEMLDKKDKE